MALPYRTLTQYEVVPREVVYVERPKIMMQLASRSNKLPSGVLKEISSPRELYDLYPDENPHQSLVKARLLINSGYNLYTQNVYKTTNKINVRFINNDDRTEAITVPFIDGINESDTSFELTNYKNSVVRLHIGDVKPKDYVILEINSGENEVQSNVLIWFHDKTREEIENFKDDAGNVGEYFFIEWYLENKVSLQYIYFWQNTGISLVEGTPIMYQISELLNRLPLTFYNYIDTNGEDIIIANNNGFINTGNIHPDAKELGRISLNVDESCITKVIAYTKSSQKVFDITSRYFTDNPELVVAIEYLNEYTYRVTVGKLFKGKILESETYVGCTNEDYAYKNKQKMLETEINEKSKLINCISYSKDFKLPEGTFYLQNTNNLHDENFLREINTNEIDMFINGLSSIRKDDMSVCPMYYDCGLDSLRYQKKLYEKLRNSDMLGLFIYRGLPIVQEGDKKHNIAFFADQTMKMGTYVINSVDLALVKMIQSSFKSGVIKEITECTTPIIKEKWVNTINSDSICTINRVVGFLDNSIVQMQYCILKPILLKEVNSAFDFSIDSVMMAVNRVTEMFLQMFGIEPIIKVVEYKVDEDGDDNKFVKTVISYETQTSEIYDTIEIKMKVNLIEENEKTLE